MRNEGTENRERGAPQLMPQGTLWGRPRGTSQGTQWCTFRLKSQGMPWGIPWEYFGEQLGEEFRGFGWDHL